VALIPPTFEEYEVFLDEELDPMRAARIEDMLQQATDAFWIFTGLSDYPADPQAARVTRYAVMDLTAWLIAQHENRAEINSPFTSERIGSYSYSKMQQAKDGQSSGIYWLDMFFRMMMGPDGSANVVSSTSENVFTPGYVASELERQTIADDGYFYGFGSPS